MNEEEEKQLKKVDIDALVMMWMTEHEKEVKNVSAIMDKIEKKFKKRREEELIFHKKERDSNADMDFSVIVDHEQRFIEYLEKDKIKKIVKSREKKSSKTNNNTNSNSKNSARLSSNFGYEFRKAYETGEVPNDAYVCQVCNEGDYQDDNMIVFCSKCSITVH